jgi:iron(III) transport system substrate-binding protein
MKLFFICFSLLSSLILFAETAFSQQLTLYSGRSKALVEPLIQEFERETGIRVRVRYGGTTQLAVAIIEEGRRTPADIFWAQDAGALGAVHRAGLFMILDEAIFEGKPEVFRNSDGTWIATSGRARVLAYDRRVLQPEALPSSILELTKPEWRGQVGWSPANASFQSFVTAMRFIEGEDVARQWLIDMQKNGAIAYNNNTSILQAIAAGEVRLGITNHYYIERAQSGNADYPVDKIFFKPGDSGNLLNVAGAGILSASRSKPEANRFLEFLLRAESQKYFLNEIFEYPVTYGFDGQDSKLQELLDVLPDIDLDMLNDLDGTLRLLRETGLL